MGLTDPLRFGDLDPCVLLYVLRECDLDAVAVEDRPSHQGGSAGIAGHGDMRLLIGDNGPQARWAVELFVVRIAQSIAAEERELAESALSWL